MIPTVWIWIAVGVGAFLCVALLLGLVFAASLEAMAEDLSVLHDGPAAADGPEAAPLPRKIAL